MIAHLLVSPVLSRMRRIKQLDFASHAFSAADHSRFAHAIGTMHIMRKILNRLVDCGETFGKQLECLKRISPRVFAGDNDADRAMLFQHLLLAGLLQDIGELPYAQATRHVCTPTFEMRQHVSLCTGIREDQLNNKQTFTLAGILDEKTADLLDPVDIGFLAYLLTGHSPHAEADSCLRPLRHMVDGTLDADRLDYVFRDAYHTYGTSGEASSVIDTILYYDDTGPVVSDAGPVSNLLVTRARLYSSVYLSPANRFRLLLLRTALRGIRDENQCAREFFGPSGADISFDDFLDLDEMTLNSRLYDFARGKFARCLDQRSRKALEIFTGKYIDYQHFWVAPPDETNVERPRAVELPDDLFFDTLSDQQRPIYHSGSVRVKNDSLRYVEDTVPLEDCAGPYSDMFQSATSTRPMKDSILVFLPVTHRGRAWEEFHAALHTGSLYDILLENDPVSVIDFPTDTRDRLGFVGPALFISFAGPDVQIVRRIAQILLTLRRRYFFYGGRFQGVGATAREKKVNAVKEADAVLIVASTSYAARYKQEPDGYIAAEIFAISTHRQHDPGFALVVLTADDKSTVRSTLPWRSAFGFDEPPFFGEPLRGAGQLELENAVRAALEAIDSDASSTRDTETAGA
ncbi:hypothetical protein ACFYTQ_21860 [Nocardia sp. NPDC004068]|uniref:hypothetical protein n=1 Tax=Nocardia sp. NPDC004068 TaxID=3364303 RepID=UPI0036A79B4E